MSFFRHALAQEVTITLNPGWTWVSYPRADTLDIATALQFVPSTNGDMIKSQNTYSTYLNGMWIGNLQQLIPGKGLMYKSMNSNAINFVFGASSIPSVTTSEVGGIGQTTATGGGVVVASGGETVTERGICWSTSHNPTIGGSHASNGAGTGTFSINMTGLAANTTYYVRAYATNSKGTAYGNEVSFTTEAEQLQAPVGAIDGLFSVNGTQQVYFSQGNLQYQASTNTWRFAENQWNYVGGTDYTFTQHYGHHGNVSGSSNNHISPTYSGWIDLFGWGTSGFNHGANCYQPWSTSMDESDYYAYGQSYYNLYDQTGQADWGCNAISNGGNQENQWRTLTGDEWEYVFNTRNTTSGIRYAKASVNDVDGVILLPDGWNVDTYPLNNTNDGAAIFSSNILTASQWITLEQNGAVFLPAAGRRAGFGGVEYQHFDVGLYWSSSVFDLYGGGAYDAFIVRFDSNSISIRSWWRMNGIFVRLVRDAE